MRYVRFMREASMGGGSGDERYVGRVKQAFNRGRLGAVALVTLLMSAEALSSFQLLQFFSFGEIAVLWTEHLAELAVVAALLTIVYTLVDEAVSHRSRRARLAIVCATLAAASVLMTMLLYSY